MARRCGLPLDPWIAPFVETLAAHGVETYESCDGGVGHCSAEPFVHFHGDHGAGFHAWSVALSFGMPVFELLRVYTSVRGELTGPTWRLVFKRGPA